MCLGVPVARLEPLRPRHADVFHMERSTPLEPPAYSAWFATSTVDKSAIQHTSHGGLRVSSPERSMTAVAWGPRCDILTATDLSPKR